MRNPFRKVATIMNWTGAILVIGIYEERGQENVAGRLILNKYVGANRSSFIGPEHFEHHVIKIHRLGHHAEQITLNRAMLRESTCLEITYSDQEHSLRVRPQMGGSRILAPNLIRRAAKRLLGIGAQVILPKNS